MCVLCSRICRRKRIRSQLRALRFRLERLELPWWYLFSFLSPERKEEGCIELQGLGSLSAYNLAGNYGTAAMSSHR